MSRKATFSLLAAAATLSVSAIAATQTWTTANADNNWDLTTPNWDAAALWTNGNDAVFAGTGEAITLGAGVTAHNLAFNSTGFSITGDTLTLTGTTPTVTVTTAGQTATINSALAGTTGLTTAGAGALVLGGTNTFTGGLTLNGTGRTTISGTNAAQTWTVSGGSFNAGILLSNAGAIGAGSTVNITAAAASTGGTLQIADNTGTVGAGSTINSLASTGRTNIALGNGNTLAANINVSANTSTVFQLALGGAATISGNITLGNTFMSVRPNLAMIPGVTSATNGTLTLSGNITGTSAARIYGNNSGGGGSFAGTIVLSGNNSGYAGTISAFGGTISFGAANNLGTGIFYFGGSNPAETGTNTSTLRYTGAGDTVANNITLLNTTGNDIIDQSGTGLLKFTSNVTATGAGSKTLTLQGSTAGTGEMAGIIADNSATNKTSVTKAGTGTWTLSGANTYTGATTVTGGTLNITGITAGSNNANVGGNQLATSRLDVAAGATVILNTGGNFSSANTATTLAGAGVIQLRSGSWWLGNGGGTTGGSIISMTEGGFIDVLSGALLKNDYANANWSANKGSLNVATGGNFDLRNNNVTVDALTGNGAVFDNGFSNTLTIGAGNTTNNATYGVALNTATFSGTIGTGGASVSLVKTGTGTQILTGTNTYTGTTTISGGTLEIGGAGSLGAGAYAGTITNTGTLAVSTSANQTLSGIISGTGQLTKSGTGTLTLTAKNTYTGITTINAGNVILTAGGASGTLRGSIIINAGGTLTGNTGDSIGYDTTAVPTLTINKGGAFVGTGTANQGYRTNFIFNGGTSTGGKLNFTNGFGITSNASDTTATIASGISSRDTNNLSFNIAQGTTASGVDLSISGVIEGATFTKTGLGTLELTGANTYTGVASVNAGTLRVGSTQATNGKLTLNGGSLTVNNGVTYNIDGGLTFASNTNATVAATSGTATIRGFDVGGADIIVNAGVAATVAASVAVSTNTYGFRVDTTGDLTIAGAISGAGNAKNAVGMNGLYVGTDSGAFYKLGTGSLTLTGASTFTAGANGTATVVENGSLVLSGGDNRLSTGSAVYLGLGTNGANLVLDGINQTITGLTNLGSGASTVTGSSATLSTLTVNNTNDYTYSGTIGGAAANANNLALVKNGTGTLTLSGANTQTGDTTVNGGTLALANLLALQNSTLNTGASGAQQVAFTVAGTNTYTLGGLSGGDDLAPGANSLIVGGNNASTTYTGSLGASTGSFTKNGSGTLTLSQTLSNTGGLAVNNGTLVAANGIASDSLTLGDGVTAGKLALGGAGANLTTLVTNGSGNAIVGATGSVTTLGLAVGSNTTLGATLGGAGTNENNLALTKTGAGDLIIADNATYAGATTISSGKLIVGSSGSLGASAITVASGAALGIETTGKTFSDLTFADGSFLNIAAANGQTTNAGLVTASGTVGVNATFSGTVNVNDVIVLLTGTGTSGLGTYELIANPDSRIQGTISAIGNNVVLHVTQAFATLIWNNSSANGIWDLNTSANFANGVVNDKFLAADRVQFDDSAAQKTVTLAGVLNSGLVTVNNSTGNDYTLTGTGSIAGSEGLVKQGQGTLFLNTTNSYTGATRITGGKISVTSLADGGVNSAIGASTNAAANLVLAGGALEYTGASAASTDRLFTIGNDATGDVMGTILSNGAGTLTFSNTGAVAYDTTDTARTLVLGGSNTGANTFNPLIGDNGAGVVSLVKADAGKWILTADNTYTGATTVSAGTLQLGTGGASGSIGSGALAIGSGATVLVDRTGTTTLAGAITGSGALTQVAPGTLVVTGDGSNYTGTTTLATGGTLQIGTTGGTAGSLSGNIVDNGTVIFERDGDYARAGAISGTGSVVKNGSGTLTVTGANTYAGTTAINTGTLEIATGGSLGTGNVSNNAALLFSQSGTTVVAGKISGSGTLAQSGTGRTILAADNDYTGDTTVTSGTLQLGNGGTTGSIAGALLLNGGNLAFARAGSYTYAQDINGNGGVEIVSGVITLSGNNGYTGTTTISGGTLLVTSASSIGAGSIAFGASGLLKYAPGFTDDLSARFSGLPLQRYNVDTNGEDITFASALTSPGGILTKSGAGVLTLTATNSYTNGTRINGGSVRIEGAGTVGSGGVTLNGGDLVVARPGDFAISGIISGAGNLTKEGTGTLVLTGANNFTGTTTINGGTLQVGDGGPTGSLGAGTVINNGTLAFNSSGTVNVGTIQGAGTISQIGSGTVIISDTAYTGAISATNGRIVMGGTATPTGGIDIAAGATLGFSSGSGETRVVSTASPITGGGNIEFSGPGTTQFTTGLGLTGSGEVFSGHTLDLGTDANANFALTSLTIDALATLRGQGRINGSVLNNGTFSPGNSPGIVTINGDFTNGAGATLIMEIAGDGGAGAVNGHDQIQYTGTAFLGGTLKLSFTGGFLPTPPTTYTLLLDTDGSSVATSGSFANIILPNGVFGRIVTTSTGLDYEVTTSASGALGNLAVPSGVQSFANAFVGLGNADPFVNAVLAKQSSGDPDGAIRDLINASPIALGSLTTLAIDEGRNASEVVRNRLDAMRRSQLPDFMEPQTVQAYAQGTGLYNKSSNDYEKATFDHSFVGGKVGLERYVAGDNGLGVNLGYDRGSADAHFGGGRMTQDHSGATVYAGFGLPRDFFIYVGAFAGYSSYETKRNTVGGTNTGDTEGYDIGATAVFGKTFDTWEGVRFTPYAGFTYTHATVNGFAETGGPLALRLDAYSQDSFRARAGFDLDKAFFDDNEEALRIGLGAVIDRELGDKEVVMRGAFANGASSSFETTSQTLPETTLSFGPYVTFGVGRGKSVRLGYRYQTGFDNSSAHRLDASFTARF